MNKSSAFSMYSASEKDKDSRSDTIDSILRREKAMLKTPKKRKSKDNKRKLSKNLADNMSKQNGIDKKIKVENMTMADVTFNKIQSQPQSTPMIKISKNKASSQLDSVYEGKQEFQKLIDPVKIDDFIKQYWEKNPLLIQRGDAKHFQRLLSIQSFDKILRDNLIEFTKNIDITSYKDGVRSTLNPEGRALPPAVWDFYSSGCSIRFLNPQSYSKEIYEMNANLQEYFHCMVGTNMYLTPPNSQGFAPHFDDIEAFVLQIEGKKRWRLYAPRNENEYLPRVSSKNFSQNEIGEPILDIVLEAGDLLYFPRGIIHQALTVKGFHSLHITTSVYQKTSWADLMEVLVPAALNKAIETNKRFREGVPLNLHQNLGVVFSDHDTPERREAIKTIKGMFDQLFENASIDDAVDQTAKKYQADALPPFISPNEKPKTVFGQKAQVNDAGEILIPFKVQLGTRIKLLKANILRLVREENVNRIYYHVDNSKVYHEYEPVFVEIGDSDAPAVEALIKVYPGYLQVKDLPLHDKQQKVAVVQDLWDRGLLMSE